MGNPFRRRRWTRARHYRAPKPLRFWPEDRKRVTARGLVRDPWRWLRVLRPFILLGILLVLWPALDPALIEPPKFLSSDPVMVDEHFGRCGGVNFTNACVVDGDTFRIGNLRFRIIGIDAPETHPSRCAEEARRGEEATVKLQALLNQGPFQMVGRIDDMTDRYGRHLRVLTRMRADGTMQSFASEMEDAGVARAYLGGLRRGWC